MEKNLLDKWQEDGFLKAEGIFSQKEVQELLKICNRIKESTDQWKEDDRPVMRHLNHPDFFNGYDEEYKTFMNTICRPELLSIASKVLEGKPLFRCTSYFYDQQKKHEDGDWHRDTQFGLPDEMKEKERILELSKKATPSIQLQIALEPSSDVEYVPGSHKRWDTKEENRIRLQDNYKNNRSRGMPGALRFVQEPGDIIAFDSKGLHRGRYHTDKVRRTLMLTYNTAPRLDFFSRQPWFLTDDKLKILPSTTQSFFNEFIEAYRERWERN